MKKSLLVLVAVLTAALLSTPTAAARPAHRTYTGTLDGAEYLVEVPGDWNGTLVLYSHGYYPENYPPPPGFVMLSTAEATAGWLLDHGYALAASNFARPTGFAVEDALTDQIRLLDWFTDTVGRPRRTISSGMSMGGGIATLLAERHPRRVDGVLSQCGEYDMLGAWNASLDLNFAVHTLLTDGTTDLVRARDPQATVDALHAGIQTALTSRSGLARLSLVAALANIPGWNSAHEPAPADLWDRIRAQAYWVDAAYVQGTGALGRVDLERRLGGNPSWNTGIDYRRQLAASGQLDTVRQAYAAAGGDLAADLAALGAAPRVRADARAVARMYRTGVVRGVTPVPVVTLHNTADGGAVADQVGWYAGQTADRQVRHLWSERGNHCAFSTADEVTALRVLERRLDTGSWPDTRPAALNAAASRFAPEFHVVKDLTTWTDRQRPPAFTAFTPAPSLRPSR
ncbi:alpha/beta hydrolase family protein [Actinophytocola xinjiangensis]|uniref:alpha/beta hydrolase family protein n=1 Tax=Actinophytocola xinjiangensis TaxID=485602 RepID=UPI000B23EA6F|nr:alpha/beta fold hydrolase [Actinophytocola xinjiangensis]